MSLPLIYAAALGFALMFALVKGSRDAKLISLAYFIAQLAAIVAHPGHWDDPQLGAFFVDILLLGWLVWVLSKTSLTWPVAPVVLQTLTVLGHCARLTVPTMPRMGYYVLIQWTAWPALATIIIGTILDLRAGRTSPAFLRGAASRQRSRPRNG